MNCFNNSIKDQRINIRFPAYRKLISLIIFCIVSVSHCLFATNVRDFGAVGDGLADDTEAIYAAIQAAEDGELYFSKGTYRISKSIEIELSKHGPLVIRGVAGASTVVMDGKKAAFIIRGSHKGSALPASVEEPVWTKEKFFQME